MPCRCDGYDSTEYAYGRKTLTESGLHEMCCQAQSLAHKLGLILNMNKIHIPHELNRILENHRAILLKHKTQEFDKDVENKKREIEKIESRIKQIKGLGGVPTQATLNQLTEEKKALDLLLSSKDNLLGGL